MNRDMIDARRIGNLHRRTDISCPSKDNQWISLLFILAIFFWRLHHTAQPRSAFGGTVTYPIDMPPLITATAKVHSADESQVGAKTGGGYTGGLSSTLGPE